jgi:hypothetical protein
MACARNYDDQPGHRREAVLTLEQGGRGGAAQATGGVADLAAALWVGGALTVDAVAFGRRKIADVVLNHTVMELDPVPVCAGALGDGVNVPGLCRAVRRVRVASY